MAGDPLAPFHPVVREWFEETFTSPSRAQALGWPAIAGGDSTLILAPTGSGKTLAAFLWCLNRLLFDPPALRPACRVVYVSPLKALAVDVERNLRAPLEGIAALAVRRGVVVKRPTVAVRTGDTPAIERARFQRAPADILITTPESIYLLLTSNARESLRRVETLIVDEIHALVPSKRGAHLAISIERLEVLSGRPLQRIGLSATQRPLDEVARFLGGVAAGARRRQGGGAPRSSPEASGPDRARQALTAEFGEPRTLRYRPVTVVDAGATRRLALRVEAAGVGGRGAGAPVSAGPAWDRGDGRPHRQPLEASLSPRLLDLVRTHRSTLIFVNNRRLAERLAAAINDLAGAPLVRSHHGSLARVQRAEVEELLKAGALRGLVATSSLELGIDMGAIDLVVQIEAPASVASALQRIGRGGHRIDAVSTGVIVPKFRTDLPACAAVTRAMRDGAVEAVRYPRNPLDVVAQQIVAMAAMDTWAVDDLFATIGRAAPFADLSRTAFEGVLDMLSGRYPSDGFAGLRPRLTWDRRRGTVAAREGARRVAVTSGGTIPDRGLFGVFLAGAQGRDARVGELDEEMVFESVPGDVFVLGASSWRIEAITHDRVLVSPAPGEPGRMPFWRGERAGRPLEFGLAIGRLSRELLATPVPAAAARLMREHDLDRSAAEALLALLREQEAATGAVPDDATIVVERLRDDYGDWRLCVLSPRGGRVHAPWAMLAAARVRDATGIDGDVLWTDDGFVLRVPDLDAPPDASLLLPGPEEIDAAIVRQLGATPLFASHFRENAARSLLLPKRRPGQRAPLWQQRRRAGDLLVVASQFGSFPVLLETYRECLRDVFDLPALRDTLAGVRQQRIRVVTADTTKASPFAASLLFGYVASFLYQGDAPLAERRAQALSIDQAELRDLLGEAELRDLLDATATQDLEAQLQRLDPRFHARSIDGLHDMLLGLGDLSLEEIAARFDGDADQAAGTLLREGRAAALTVNGTERIVAIEDIARVREALGVDVPADIPELPLHEVADPSGDLVARYARTHVPFTMAHVITRFGLSRADAEAVLSRLTAAGRLIEGAFTAGVTEREWADPEVLRQLRRRSLARLRHEVEPMDPAALGRLATTWHGVVHRRGGVDALLDVVEQLQGAPLVASLIDTEILPARLDSYHPADLDALAAAGDIVWVGLEPLGERDGRVALYLASAIGQLLQTREEDVTGDLREAALVEALRTRGASFFGPLHEAAGGGYPGETVRALWALVWRGVVTNDTFHPLRAFTRPESGRRARAPAAPRPRRAVPPAAGGRWSLVPRTAEARGRGASDTMRLTAVTRQLLARHGIVTRDTMNVEAIAGGFGAIYPVLRAMEDRGHARRGYFVAGLGASQFGLPGAVDLLRSMRQPAHGEVIETALLAATDPANPYGATLKFPTTEGRAPMRAAGARVVLVNGALAAYLPRTERALWTWIPEIQPERARTARAVASALLAYARSPALPLEDASGAMPAPRGLLLEEIDGVPATQHPLASIFVEAGFSPGALGLRATF